MRSWMIAASLGIVVAGTQSQLVNWPVPVTVCLLLALLTFSVKLTLLVSAGFIADSRLFFLLAVFGFCFGFAWANTYGHWRSQHLLTPELSGELFQFEGTVTGLPQRQRTPWGAVLRFQAKVSRLQRVNASQPLTEVPRLISLRWYPDSNASDKRPDPADNNIYNAKLENLKPGDFLRAVVRLKRPYGSASPGAFDYERWMVVNGIDASGTVKSVQRIEAGRSLTIADFASRWRYQLRQQLYSKFAADTGFGSYLALLIGDKQGLSDAQWQLLRATGTNHLMVISGLHIGMVALCVYGFSHLLMLACLRSTLRMTQRQRIAGVLALAAALLYTALAGFSIPTCRASILVACALLGRIFGFAWPVSNALSLALMTILLWQPLAFYSVGFILSFAAVAILLLAGLGQRAGGWSIWQWLRPQWYLALALTPLLVVIFQQFSLLAPLVNLVAIPLVSLVLVPLCLLSALLFLCSDRIGDAAVEMSLKGLELYWLALEGLVRHVPLADTLGEIYLASTAPVYWLCSLIGAALLLLPRALLLRREAWLLYSLLFLPVLVGKLSHNPQHASDADGSTLTVSFLDVGQGTSIVVETAQHRLVYDMGRRFASGFDMGKAVLLPFLRSRQIEHIDIAVLSHNDLDHSGGMQALASAESIDKVFFGEPLTQLPALPATASAERCLRGRAWEWDGVRFEFLHPDTSVYSSSNNYSCVLRISIADQVILLTGDIEKQVENALLNRELEKLSATIIAVPHHGSKTSSRWAFVRAVDARFAVVNAGYLNPFHHPHADIVSRWREQGAELINTAKSGTVEFRWQDGQWQLRRWRDELNQYWRHEISAK